MIGIIVWKKCDLKGISGSIHTGNVYLSKQYSLGLLHKLQCNKEIPEMGILHSEHPIHSVVPLTIIWCPQQQLVFCTSVLIQSKVAKVVFPVVASELFGWYLSDIWFVSNHGLLYDCRNYCPALPGETPGWWKWASRRGRGGFKHFFLLIKILASRVCRRVCQHHAWWASPPEWAPQRGPQEHCAAAQVTPWLGAGTTSWLPFPSTKARCGTCLKACWLLTDYSQVIIFYSEAAFIFKYSYRKV